MNGQSFSRDSGYHSFIRITKGVETGAAGKSGVAGPPAMNGICHDVAWIIFCLYGIYLPAGKEGSKGCRMQEQEPGNGEWGMCCHDGRRCPCAPFVAADAASLALHKCFAF